jgi:hypothetical protein
MVRARRRRSNRRLGIEGEDGRSPLEELFQQDCSSLVVAGQLRSPRNWERQGPAPNTEGQVEGIADREIVGAIKAVAPHPTDPNIAYIGSVNGGVWKTTNAPNPHPTWEQLTDSQKSLSIGALEFDPTDGYSETLVEDRRRARELKSSFAPGSFFVTDSQIVFRTEP